MNATIAAQRCLHFERLFRLPPLSQGCRVVCVCVTMLLLAGCIDLPDDIEPPTPSAPVQQTETKKPDPSREEPSEQGLVKTSSQPPPIVETPTEIPTRTESEPKPKPIETPKEQPKATSLAEAEILDGWTSCKSARELHKHVAEGRVNATTAYLYQLADILADPYCPDDQPSKFLSYRHFRQMNDRMERIIELKKQYEKFDNVDASVLARGTDTVSHLKHIQDSFAEYKLSQSALFWKGITDFVTTDKSLGEIAGAAAIGAIDNRLEFEMEMRDKVDELQTDWKETLDRIAKKNIRAPDLLWAPLPPPQTQHGWIPFPEESSRKYSLGKDAVTADKAVPVEFADGVAQFSGQLTCTNKQHVYKLENDDFRMMSMIVTKDAPVLFSIYSLQLFSDFDPGQVYHSAMPDENGVASFLLGPGTYYLRLLSWRDVIYSDAPLNYSIAMYRGQKLREHLTSGRVFVGFEESNGSIKPFRMDFKFAENDRITGRISWPTLLSETFFEGEYIETPSGIKLRFTETKIAKRSPFSSHRVFTGGVYTLEPKVYDRRFVLEGKWTFQNRRGQIRCLSAGLHDISLNDSARKQVISQLSKDYKHTGRIEQNEQLLEAHFTLVYDESRGDTSGFIYWPRHPVKNRMKQYTDGVVIDTPSLLLLRLVDTRFTAAGVRSFPANTTTFFLQPKSGATGQGFLGRWRQGGRATGLVDVTVQ